PCVPRCCVRGWPCSPWPGGWAVRLTGLTWPVSAYRWPCSGCCSADSAWPTSSRPCGMTGLLPRRWRGERYGYGYGSHGAGSGSGRWAGRYSIVYGHMDRLSAGRRGYLDFGPPASSPASWLARLLVDRYGDLMAPCRARFRNGYGARGRYLGGREPRG